MSFDLHNNIVLKRVISPVAVGDNTAQVGQIIDRQGFGSLEFGILAGTLADADATFTALVEESDNSDLSGGNTVASTDLLGAAADLNFTFAADDTVRKLGYKGIKRYVRLTITPAANSGSAPIAAFALLGHADLKKITQPTA